MIVRYIDTHCHLQLKQYENDREQIIARMRDKGVAAIVVGDDLASSKEAIALAEKHKHLYATVGMHPNHAEEEHFHIRKYRKLAEHPKVVAIGECGLDYFRGASNEIRSAQKELFKKHLALAAELDKPLAIHARPSKNSHDTYEDLIEILKEAKTKYPNLRGIVHFFAGTLKEAEEFSALDFTISFTAVITFARDYDDIICTVPLANILSETDAPYVAPASRRGERNDPLAVIDVVQQIAAIRGENPESVRITLLANVKRLFAL